MIGDRMSDALGGDHRIAKRSRRFRIELLELRQLHRLGAPRRRSGKESAAREGVF